jgi:hypothetical protein
MLPFFSEHIQDRKQPIPQIMKNQLFSREQENKEKMWWRKETNFW